MLQRTCGEGGRGSRALTERGHRRRRRENAARFMIWPADVQTDAPAPNQPSASRPVRAPTRLPGRPPEAALSGQAEPLEGVAWLWQILGQSPAARDQWSELLRLAATSADTPVRAETLNLVGRFAGASGDPTTAHAFFQEALITGRAQNAASVARSLCGLARIAIGRGAFDLARTLQEEALELQRRLGQPAAAAGSLAVLGWLSLEPRGVRQAETFHEESLTLRVTLGEPLALAYSLVHLGWLAHLTGGRRWHADTLPRH